jgi:hypothetical protein
MVLSRSRAGFSQHVVLFGIVLTTIAIAFLGIPTSLLGMASTPSVTQKQAEAIAYKLSPGTPQKEAIKGIAKIITDDYCYTVKKSDLEEGMKDLSVDTDSVICGKKNLLSFEHDYAEETDTILSPISVDGNIISYKSCSRGKDVPEGGLKILNTATIVKVGWGLKVKNVVSVMLASCDAK